MAPVLVLLLLLLLLVSLVTGDGVAAPVVHTSTGVVRGVHLTSFSGRQYAAFRGIPYASPPVGELRFSPPEPAAAWSHERDATTYGSACLQYNIMHFQQEEGDEDCLFINVFTPRLPGGAASGDDLPVLVWIHGGGFVSGSGDDELFGMDYLLDEDVVVVTLNYRLGVFGFYTSEDAAAPGNMGLLDQQLALQWVQNNIGRFGGDRRRVTIFGESAGGASVSLQVLSPLATGLFHGAISQSGAPTASWAMGSPQQPLAQQMAQKLNCNDGDSSSDWLACFRRVSATEILHAHGPFPEGLHVSFHPRVDGADSSNPVLPDEPNLLLQRGDFNRVPRVIGQLTDEGLAGLFFVQGNAELLERLRAGDLEVWSSNVLLGGGGIGDKTREPLQVAAQIRDRLLADAGGDLVRALMPLLEARYFTLSIESEANLTAQFAPVFKYLVDERGPGQMRFQDVLPPQWSPPMPENLPPTHADDLAYLFRGHSRPAVRPNSPQHRMIRVFTKLWTSFAQSGVPSMEGVPAWPLYQESSGRHLRLNAAPSVGSHAFGEAMRFWRSLPLKESWNADVWAAGRAAGVDGHDEL